MRRRVVKLRIGRELLYLRPEDEGRFLVYRVASSTGIVVDGRFALVFADCAEQRPVAAHPFFPHFVATLELLGVPIPTAE
jgi:hypothetical protein